MVTAYTHTHTHTPIPIPIYRHTDTTKENCLARAIWQMSIAVTS